MNILKRLKLKRMYNKELDKIRQEYFRHCNSYTYMAMMHRHDNNDKNYKSFKECCDIANKFAKEIYLKRKEEIDIKYMNF